MAALQSHLSQITPCPSLRPRIRRDPRDLLSVMQPSIGYPAGIANEKLRNIYIHNFRENNRINMITNNLAPDLISSNKRCRIPAGDQRPPKKRKGVFEEVVISTVFNANVGRELDPQEELESTKSEETKKTEETKITKFPKKSWQKGLPDEKSLICAVEISEAYFKQLDKDEIARLAYEEGKTDLVEILKKEGARIPS